MTSLFQVLTRTLLSCQMDRIDPHYYAHSSRVSIREETRINATREEATQWEESHRLPDGIQKPHFLSDIYYLALATSHYGLGKTIDNFDELSKELEELKKRLKQIEDDSSWAGVTHVNYGQRRHLSDIIS